MLNPFAQAGFLISCAQLVQLPDDAQPEVAFAGRSNAGKSSALNLICGQKQLARVSKTPGRTQLLNLFGVPGGRFVDLPGYGYAAVPRAVRVDWGKLVGSYLEGRKNLVGIVLIMDIRHPLTDYDRQMLGWAAHRGISCHCLLTKADKLGYGASKTQLQKVRKELESLGENVSVQLFSSETRQGLEEAQTMLIGWMGITAETTFANWIPPQQ